MQFPINLLLESLRKIIVTICQIYDLNDQRYTFDNLNFNDFILLLFLIWLPKERNYINREFWEIE